MAKKKKETIDEVEVVEVKEKVINENKNNFISTIIMGLVGLILIFLPETSNKFIGYIIGGALLVMGIIFIIKKWKDDKNASTMNLISGILYCILGLLVLIYPLSIMKLLTLVLGVYLIVNGTLKVHSSLLCRSFMTNKWISLLIAGVVIIIFGIVLIINPFSGLVITKVAGVFLLVSAVFDIINALYLKK